MSYANIITIVSNMMAHTWSQYGGVTSLDLFDFDVLTSSLNGILKDPDPLEYTQLENLVTLFEKLSYIEDYKLIALDGDAFVGSAPSEKTVHNSVTMYFDLAERMFGKLYLEKKKIQTEPPHIRYPGMDFNDVLAEEQKQKGELDAFSLRVHNGLMRFIKEISLRLGTEENSYFYIGDTSFEFKAWIGYPPDFEGQQYFIRNSDVYWEIPAGFFDQHQDIASSKQQVYIIAIKWFANPHMLNGESYTHAGTNMTSMLVYDTAGNEIIISNLTNPISVVFPYKRSSGYEDEFLKCQYFDETENKFLKTGCGNAFVENVKLPCTTCTDVNNTFVYADTFVCRCNHLTTIGGVYEPTSMSKRSLPQIGIYQRYYAMNYWTQSFGYYLIWPVGITYLIAVIVAIIMDLYTMPKMKKKILEIVIEVYIYNEEQEKNRLLYGPEEEKRLDSDDAAPNGDMKKQATFMKSQNSYKMITNKDEAIKNSNTLDFNGERYFKASQGNKKINRDSKLSDADTELEGGELNGNGTELMTIPSEAPKEEEKIPDNASTGTKKKKKKKIFRLKKKKNGSEKSQKETAGAKKEDGKSSSSNSEEEKKDEEEKKTQSESDGSEYEELNEFNEMEKDYRVPSKLEIFEKHRSLSSMLFYSNSFSNAIFVTSFMSPRHIRVLMVFFNLIMIWFLVAVFFNNTKDPLVVPNFDKQARSLALNEMWIALVVPIVTMAINYTFWGIFMISDSRFHQKDSFEQVKKQKLIPALLREIYLRFFMAYFVIFALAGAIMWYVIEFTARFGWKVSWTWWYSGAFSFMFNYFLYDPLITWFHYVMYGCSRNLWRKVMSYRGTKVACPEVVMEDDKSGYFVAGSEISPMMREKAQARVQEIMQDIKDGKYKEEKPEPEDQNINQDESFVDEEQNEDRKEEDNQE